LNGAEKTAPPPDTPPSWKAYKTSLYDAERRKGFGEDLGMQQNPIANVKYLHSQLEGDRQVDRIDKVTLEVSLRRLETSLQHIQECNSDPQKALAPLLRSSIDSMIERLLSRKEPLASSRSTRTGLRALKHRFEEL
jgi:hypothetical protein